MEYINQATIIPLRSLFYFLINLNKYKWVQICSFMQFWGDSRNLVNNLLTIGDFMTTVGTKNLPLKWEILSKWRQSHLSLYKKGVISCFIIVDTWEEDSIKIIILHIFGSWFFDTIEKFAGKKSISWRPYFKIEVLIIFYFSIIIS
jgi:hypothetical protein